LIAFQYTNNEKIEKEYRKIISFTLPSIKIKHQETNLTKEVKDLYKDNYKPLEKEIEEDYRR
jgi:hypothetical protein